VQVSAENNPSNRNEALGAIRWMTATDIQVDIWQDYRGRPIFHGHFPNTIAGSASTMKSPSSYLCCLLYLFLLLDFFVHHVKALARGETAAATTEDGDQNRDLKMKMRYWNYYYRHDDDDYYNSGKGGGDDYYGKGRYWCK
jgi:hypothetical protein